MKIRAYSLFVVVFCLTVPCFAEENTGEGSSAELIRARTACRELGSALKTRLMATVQANNFTGALQVCQTEAPIITGEISKRLGLTIRRTTLKTRNTSNLVHPWERKGLESLKRQIAAGAAPEKAEVFETVAGMRGEQVVRYMKPIMMGALCMTCHGTDISPILQQEIRTRYPGDQATGYQLGELRGAFSVEIPYE